MQAKHFDFRMHKGCCQLRFFRGKVGPITEVLTLPAFFYQSIDLPDGFHKGQWDHRNTTDPYLGKTDFRGKTVLDVGPGSGFWTFEIERRGGNVIAIELSENDKWDIVPHDGRAADEDIMGMKHAVAGIQEAFWHSHRLLNSRSEVIRCSVYDIPKHLEKVDIALMGNILQHLRDPFLGLECVASVVTQRLLVSESLWNSDSEFVNKPLMQLLPTKASRQVTHSWYQTSPSLVQQMLEILGFDAVSWSMHHQLFVGTDFDQKQRMVPHYTCVADRKV